MKFTVRARHYATPLVIGGLMVGMVAPSRDEADQPHTDIQEHVALNFYGGASIQMIATSSSGSQFYSVYER
jgi:hypothetical protein